MFRAEIVERRCRIYLGKILRNLKEKKLPILGKDRQMARKNQEGIISEEHTNDPEPCSNICHV